MITCASDSQANTGVAHEVNCRALPLVNIVHTRALNHINRTTSVSAQNALIIWFMKRFNMGQVCQKYGCATEYYKLATMPNIWTPMWTLMVLPGNN